MTLLSTNAARMVVVAAGLAFTGCAAAPPGSVFAPSPTELSICAAENPGGEPARASETTVAPAFFAEPQAALWIPAAFASRYRFLGIDTRGPLAGFADRLDRPPKRRT